MKGFILVFLICYGADGASRVRRWGGGGGGGGQGTCSSNNDCPSGTPVCSEHGYCQCASYRTGGADCWKQGGGGGGGGWNSGGGGGGAGKCSSGNDCPSGTPVCSEYGFCQCASYRPGGAECWQQGGGGGGGGGGWNTGGGNVQPQQQQQYPVSTGGGGGGWNTGTVNIQPIPVQPQQQVYPVSTGGGGGNNFLGGGGGNSFGGGGSTSGNNCAGRASECWSPGVADTDCPGNGLCEFDGCANVCVGGGGGGGFNTGGANAGIGQYNQRSGVGTWRKK